MTTDLPAPLRDWLATLREQLNGKFRLAQRRYPTLAPETALALCRELLPPVAEHVGDAPELFAALFDLILLHAGRGLIAPMTPGLADASGSRSPALSVLLREVFPRLATLLAVRPKQLPGALSNAVENLGPLGLDFARRLSELAERIPDAAVLLDAGAVLAWRLGDARLRKPALDLANKLPADLVAHLLDLPGAPVEAVLRDLSREGWLLPGHAAPGGWHLAARLGNFAGFAGAFAAPPVLLDAGDDDRHRFWVRAGGHTYRLDGDTFGHVCRPDAAGAYPTAPATCDAMVPVPAEATSVLVRPDLLAYTRADSFRVRVLVRRREM